MRAIFIAALWIALIAATVMYDGVVGERGLGELPVHIIFIGFALGWAIVETITATFSIVTDDMKRRGLRK